MDGDPVKSFGLVIKRIRKAQGLSQESLATDANLDRAFISQVENGRKQPSLLTIFRLADALKLSVSDLLKQVEAVLAGS
ncbi:helix-turn-helix domain-containing protein [Hymenobacter sp. NST-14]|uniref:helix-turn-helix domain-containing protein n=1 Tax=Hymenobacter piscis TaxID=2839984 RepID=UPI001C028F90|nr:helix-turn-helix transcriptional regulator [Hymenobacter piscis]MBT9395240.1 helix-turn-helix domain-containing protein [Hymenobacter piscis]